MPTLYHCAQSRGVRALWTIEEMGIDCDLVMLPFPPRHAKPDYLDINPLGTVPMLIDGTTRMTESTAIAEYLATRYGPTDLAVGVDEPDYGIYLDYLHHADTTLTFPLTVHIRFGLMEKERGLEAAGAAYLEWFSARLIKIDQQLADKDYLCAGRFTIADIAISYALLLARLTGNGHRLSPSLMAYLDRQLSRPAYIRMREREIGALAAQRVSGPGT